jgi:molybdate transport system substrate-binding protein
VSLAAVAQEITVAAAADLNSALREVAQKYEAKTGTKIKLTFGSSGNFFNGIRNGAPYDIFFSADVDYPKQLEAAGFTETGTLYEYAVGRLVLSARANSPFDVNVGMKLLGDPRVKKVAIANPQHAPYGRAAVAAMKSAGVYAQAEPRLVLGENISQTFQFVQTGNADVGLIALSLVMQASQSGQNGAPEAKYWVVPADSYPPIRQAAVVIRSSRAKEAARKFLEFVKSDEARDILKKYGFEKP